MYECPAFSPSVVDRVGAGDAFFALTSPWAYKAYERELMTFVGNCVGAIKVAIVGNRSSVEPVPLFRFISTLLK
jgi:sugar/nucleoside kinase (ribokinase family)